MKKIICFLFLFYFTANAQEITRLANAHSHNDYEQVIPLFEALNNGFTSIEADIFLIKNELYVAHEINEIKKEKTLINLYLEPLKKIIEEKDKRYSSLFPITLLIDIKSEGLKTYLALESLLKKYEPFITSFTDKAKREKQINVIISGNRPIKYMSRQNYRLAAVDGRPEDIEKSSFLFPLISENVVKVIGKTREEKLVKTILSELVNRVHKNNKKLRLWGVPDKEEFWQIQYDSKLDFIGTDQPARLKNFLIKKGNE